MNMFKKSMAMFLTLCMLLSMVPMAAFADDTVPAVTEATGETVVETTAATEAAEETTAPTESSEEAPEKNRMAPEEKKAAPGKHKGDHKKPNHDATEPVTEATEEVTEATEDATEPTLDPYGIATMDLEAGIATAAIEVATEPTLDPYGIATMDLEAGIATIAEKPTAPADGTTIGEPFPEKTAGSYSFRIPALVTLSDGTLVAAADARWNTTYDGGGLDTIVARSSNGGANWSYTFANYLGDNGNEYNGASSCFIDPSMAVTSNDTIYMLCDLYPNGVALNGNKQCNPDYSTGFNADGYLKLTTVDPSPNSNNYIDADFTHYLKNGQIYPNESTTPVDGYTVDSKFNVYQNGTYVSNLFFSDSPYHVARTGYLYLTKSTDKGATWSEPTLLNLKTTSEQVCLVGPNGGMVTSKGVIVFPVYSYTGSAEYTGLIYSTNGTDWQRSASLTSIDSSEADVVELANGKLRVFFRNEKAYLCYADYDLTSNSWSNYVNTQVHTNSNTELSAITYSQKVDGKQVILVSCPASANLAGSSSSDGSWRTSGRIFAGLVDPETYNMTWLDQSVAVTPVATSQLSGSNYTAAQGFFAYSSIAELKNSSVAILYEDNQYGWGYGDNYSYTMDFKTYSESDLETAFGVTFGSTTSGGDTETEGDVTITSGATLTTATKNENVTALSGKTYVAYDITVNEASVTSATVVVKLNGAFADDANLVAHYIDENGAIAETINGTYDTAADTFTFTATHFSTYAITETETETVTLKVGDTTTKTISGVNVTGSNADDATSSAIATVTWTGTEAVSAKGTRLSDNSQVYLTDCLFTFTDHATDGYYIVESTSIAGRYLNNIMPDASATEPISATAGKVSLELGYTDMFQFTFNPVTGSTYGNSTGSAHLHFHTEKQPPYWDRCGTDTTNNCYEYLYRAVRTGESSSTEIPGYIRVTSLDGIESGDQYLIAHTNEKKYYVLYPGTTQNECVVQVDSDSTATAASTTVTITGNSVGETSVQVGNIRYNIEVTHDFDKEVNVELEIGASQTFTDSTGNYEGNPNNIAPNEAIAKMKVEGTTTAGNATITPVTALDLGDTFYIQVSEGVYRTANGGTTDELSDAGLWKVSYYIEDWKWLNLTNEDGQSLRVVNSSITVDTSATFFTFDETKGIYYDTTNDVVVGHPVKIVGTEAVNATDITFTGVAVGETTAYVGNTKYNISVAPAGIDAIVNIEVEIGETFTYTDTTGNHSANVTQQPDGTYATMVVTGVANATQQKLVPVTAKTFETGKLYVIENVRTANPNHAAYQPDHSVLTATEEYGGLVMNGPLDVATSQKWSFTPSDNMYFVKANGEYIQIGDGGATMESTAQSLSFEYVADSGWLIYYNKDGNNTSDDGDYFLSDLRGINSGEAFGYTTKNDDGNYWNIYEVVDETTTEATKVAFTGVAAGTTTAIVGNTQYNITVVAQSADDEVMNSGTGIWTVDPEIQRNRYNSIVNGKHKDLYTDDSWKQYEEARQAAYKKLVEVTNAQYTSQADASAALAELTDLVNALEVAAGKLVAAKTISVRYQLNGSTLDTREYKVTGTDNTLTLPATIVVDNVAYTVNNTELTLGGDTTYDVPVTKVGKLGGGFVASADINAGNHNGHTQVADLVDDFNNKKKITEMTLTVGIKYDLDLATDTTGYTVEWTTDDGAVATVDENGKVTAVGAGTTTIVATVKDANGNVVEVNSIPVTVFPVGTDDRNTAIYIEEVTNTTVWCVVNGDTQNYAFEVVEGELIYGQFDTTVSDGTKTTAMSFFGNPDEAHALVYMKSTGSDDQYFMLHDDEGNLYDGTVTPNDGYYVSGVTSGAGYWQAVGLSGNQTGTNTPGWSIIKDMVQWAIDQGCDGGLGFTRRESEGDLASNLSFASDPMPRIEKTVDGVLPTSRMQADYRRYQPGMVAAVHELVYFKITVTQEIPTVWTDDNKNYGEITYSSALITDTILPGAYLYTKELDRADGTYDGEIAVGSRVQEDDITAELNGAWTAEQKAAGKRTFDYYLVYEIQESDIPKFWIDNIANLSYNYQSKYSKGAQAGAADAEARISVVGTAIDDVVIDFGQSFTYAGHKFTSITDNQEHTFKGLRNVHLKGAYVNEKSKATAKYGDVTVNAKQLTDEEGNLRYDDKGYPEYEYTVTYTPTKILQGPDTVLIYGLGENNQEKIINGFVVYPATSVYYEEGFLFETNSGWNTDAAKKATKEQSFELLGMSKFDNNGMLTGKISNKKYNYGYDPLYPITNEGKVADSYAEANEIGDTATFTFTGDGIQIFANSKPTSGYVSVEVKNPAGKIMNLSMVDTATTAGDTPATTGQTGDLNGLPIVSLVDLQNIPHDTYTVTLTKIMEKEPVYITGARVFNTVEDSSVFAIDLEDNPEFYELRDSVLHAVDVNKTASEMYGSDWMNKGSVQIGPLSEQVYGSIRMDPETEEADTENPVAVVTSLETIYGTSDEPATAQDLLDNGPKNELYLYGGQTLTFKVKTSRIMQIGLKAPQGATTASITGAGDTKTPTVNSSVDMFYDLVPTATKDGQYTVSITNSGSAILSVTLLKVCDDPSFAFSALTEQDIEDLLVNVYGLSDSETPTVPSEPEELPSEPETEPSEPETKPTEPSKPGKPGNNKPGSNKPGNNKPGRPGADTKQAEAVLNIVFINLRGKQVGTATLTETGNAKDRCVFSASEISAQAPARYRALWFTHVIVSYGDTARIIVPVI